MARVKINKIKLDTVHPIPISTKKSHYFLTIIILQLKKNLIEYFTHVYENILKYAIFQIIHI